LAFSSNLDDDGRTRPPIVAEVRFSDSFLRTFASQTASRRVFFSPEV
jgi:hypothetical protein